MNVRVGYLEKASGHATEDEVAQELGNPTEKQENDGRSVWRYRETGASASVLTPTSGVGSWCRDYWLTFDENKILRSWVQKECSEP